MDLSFTSAAVAVLTNWGRDKMAIISQTTLSNAFSWMKMLECHCCCFNKLRPKQNGHHFADYTFKCIFLNENVRISIKISLMFVAKGPINNIPVLIQIMAWRRQGDKAPSHYLNQWWLDYRHIYASLGLNALRSYTSVLGKDYFMVTYIYNIYTTHQPDIPEDVDPWWGLADPIT